MAWNYRKRIKIAPGVHLNISKGGVSTSIGPKGTKITIGKNGSFLNTGILGTGLYFRKKIFKTNRENRRHINSCNYAGIDLTDNNRYLASSCLKAIGVFIIVVILIVSFYHFYNNPNFIDMTGLIVFLLIIVALFVVSFRKKSANKTEGDMGNHTVNNLSPQKVDILKKELSQQDEKRIKEAEAALNQTSEPIKKRLLQCFIDYYNGEANNQPNNAYEELCGHGTTDFHKVINELNIGLLCSYVQEVGENYKEFKEGRFYYLLKTKFYRKDEGNKPSFNYTPYNSYDFSYIFFKDSGVTIYFYPDFVIAARSHVDFDIVDYNDFDIVFEKQRFVGKPGNSFHSPKQVSQTRYTKYPVYELGVMTFLPYKLILLINDSDESERFYYAFKEYKESKTRIVFDNSKEITVQFDNPKEEFVQFDEPSFYSRFEALTEKNSGNSDITKDFADLNFGATKEYYDKVYAITKPFCEFFDTISNDAEIMQIANNTLPDSFGEKRNKLIFLFYADLIKCFEQLGHDSTNLFSKEGLPMSIIETYVFQEYNYSYQIIRLQLFIDAVKKVSAFNGMIKDAFLANNVEDHFYINDIFQECGKRDYSIHYFSNLYKFFSIIAKADNKVSIEESRWLEKLMSFTQTPQPVNKIETNSNSIKEILDEWKQDTVGKNDVPEVKEPISAEKTDPMMELQTLIGLSEVKTEVSALANFVKIQKERERNGMKAVGLSYHCVFTGNPGTGKTTVARIVAEIYKELGVIKKGHLVETDRSGLVAEYIGQTAVKTNKIIDSALDGVLFIDEAYSLVQGHGNDYGHEAISTLLKRMEDDRDRLVVIIAGYSKEIKDFVDSNPGLQSRFNRYIHFADYTADELKKIFMLNVEQNQYLLESEGEEQLNKILNYAIENKDKNFGNGRYVRNLFEKTIQNQAIRLSCQPKITAEELSKLKAEDLPTKK